MGCSVRWVWSPALGAVLRDDAARPAANAGGQKTRKMTGTVKFFNSARGYGFVEHRGGEDLFVHHSQVEGDARRGIAPGSTVEFTIGVGRRGDEAHNLKVLTPGEGRLPRAPGARRPALSCSALSAQLLSCSALSCSAPASRESPARFRDPLGAA